MYGRGISTFLVLLVICSPHLIISGHTNQKSGDLAPYNLADCPDISIVNIQTDTDFVSQNWPGNGTEDSPYLISGLQFSHDESWVITIENTRSHFILRDCIVNQVYDFGWADYGGVIINNVSNFIIENCTFERKRIALALGRSENGQIRNNTIVNCDVGMNTDLLSNCVISNNSIINSDTGINFHRSYYSTIIGNTIVESDIGIVTHNESDNNTITRNRIGWCSYYNARDYCIGNNWSGNSWSDWNEIGLYLIGGSAGSIDTSPSLINEDLRGPTFDFDAYHGTDIDSYEPLDSFTFEVNISDDSSISTVILFIRDTEWCLGASRALWIDYEMNHSPVGDNPNRYTYTFDCNGGFGASYHFWANDSLGNARHSNLDIVSISWLGYNPYDDPTTTAQPQIEVIAYILLPISLIIVVFVVWWKRLNVN